jgi:hypothetical protein
MVLDLFLNVWIAILNFMGFLLPNWKIPEASINGINHLTQSLSTFNDIFPIGHLLIAIGFVIGYQFTKISISLTISLLNFFRGSGGIKFRS